MSSYTKTTLNPRTCKWEKCLWIDDYFGRHKYGVKFPDGWVVDPEKEELETKEEENE